MIEVTFVQVEDGTTRTIGTIRVNDEDLAAAPEQPNPVDARTLGLVKHALQRIEDETADVLKQLKAK